MQSRGRKMFQAKLKSSGRLQMDRRGSNLNDKTNVNEEYKEAFRTKSYVEMWCQVHGQLEKSSFDRLSSSSSISNYHINLSEYLIKPRKETLGKIEDSKFHHLLLNYFKAGLEACNLCELLLQSIHQTRVYYQKIRRVIEMNKRMQEFSNEQCSVILKELAGFALLKNPLSIISPVKFQEIHETNMDLFRRLTSQREKIKRQAKSKRISKQIGRFCLVISHTALLTALLVLAFHSVIGVIAAPVLVSCFFDIKKKKKNSRSSSNQQGLKTSLIERQLDISAKGIYILINDFDTISRLAWRSAELNHTKPITHQTNWWPRDCCRMKAERGMASLNSCLLTRFKLKIQQSVLNFFSSSRLNKEFKHRSISLLSLSGYFHATAIRLADINKSTAQVYP